MNDEKILISSDTCSMQGEIAPNIRSLFCSLWQQHLSHLQSGWGENVIDDDQIWGKCFSPSKVVVRKCFAPWDNNIANISNNSLIMWMIIGSIDCAGDQIITFIVPNRHYLMSWFNTTSVQPVLLLCCYTVMMLFCYAVMPLFCYAVIQPVMLNTLMEKGRSQASNSPASCFQTWLPYIVTLLHCYIVTLLHCYIVTL